MLGYSFSVCLVVFMAIFSGCSSTDTDEPLSGQQAEEKSYSDIVRILADQDYIVESSVDVGGGTGYIALNQGDTGTSEDDKRCIVLQGSAYDMGYEFGALRPEATYVMSTEYLVNMVEELTGLEADDNEALFNLIFKAAHTLCIGAIENEKAIPRYLIDEMKGMADGAKSQGYDVSFDNILLVNESIDALYSMIITGNIPDISKEDFEMINSDSSGKLQQIGTKVMFRNANLPAVGCNAFVVSGEATIDGKVYHGRDFMFPTGGYFHKEAMMGIYLPDDGLPFVTVAAPGFVGIMTGLNAEGLSMGMDVSFGGATRNTPGLGCLLVTRDVVQNCTGLDSALYRIEHKQNRGVTWDYILADDKFSATYTNGAVLETGMTYGDDGEEFKTGADVLPYLTRLSMLDIINKLEGLTEAEGGIMFRNQEWTCPDAFKGVEGYDVQEEELPAMVLATNHYVIPGMIASTKSWWVQTIKGLFIGDDTYERYDDLNARLTDAYGAIDYEKAKEMIDFLNPLRYADKDSDEYRNMIEKGFRDWEGYYEVDAPIEGHHNIYDNQDMIAESLFGSYSSGNVWARVDLKPFKDLK